MANLVYCKNNCLKNHCYFALSTTPACNPTQLPLSHTDIANSGASGFYFAPGAPVANLNPRAPIIGVRVANGRPERSVASATLASTPSLPPAAMQGHVMCSFPHTLIGLGPFANIGCQIVFTKMAVFIIHLDGHSILEGCENKTAPASGDSYSTPPRQAVWCPRCMKIMRNRAQAEALPIFQPASRQPN